MENNDTMDDNDIKRYLESHKIYTKDILPCGHRLERFNNDYVYEMIMLLHDTRKELRILKRQISAHDFNITNLLRDIKK